LRYCVSGTSSKIAGGGTKNPSDIPGYVASDGYFGGREKLTQKISPDLGRNYPSIWKKNACQIWEIVDQSYKNFFIN